MSCGPGYQCWRRPAPLCCRSLPACLLGPLLSICADWNIKLCQQHPISPVMTYTTVQWLEAAGLSSDTVKRVERLSLHELRQLMISDYERFGILDMGEKQRLFRALQTSHSTPLISQLSPLAASEEDAVQLVDLDDDDFLTQVWLLLCWPLLLREPACSSSMPAAERDFTLPLPAHLLDGPQDLDLEGFSDQAFMLSPAPSAPDVAGGRCVTMAWGYSGAVPIDASCHSTCRRSERGGTTTAGVAGRRPQDSCDCA